MNAYLLNITVLMQCTGSNESTLHCKSEYFFYIGQHKAPCAICRRRLKLILKKTNNVHV